MPQHHLRQFKLAEKNGITLSDPAGQQCQCHPPLVSWIADLPEQYLLACVLVNQSPYTLAICGQFGDLHAFPPRHRHHTLNLIRQACASIQPDSLPEFVKVCYALGPNGVHQPFWKDWGNADPPLFLTVNVLYAFHKFFFDHPLKWVINIMGREELDRHMAAIQPREGEHHWQHGISKLKQVNGWEHQDLQKILISMIAGTVPNIVLCAVRALVKFIFQAQGLLLYEDHLHSMLQALCEFHYYKSSIIVAGG